MHLGFELLIGRKQVFWRVYLGLWKKLLNNQEIDHEHIKHHTLWIGTSGLKWHSAVLNTGRVRSAQLKPMYLICTDWCVCTSDGIKLSPTLGCRPTDFARSHHECINLAVCCEIESINSAARSPANLDWKARRGKGISSYLRVEKKKKRSFVLIDYLSENDMTERRREGICRARWTPPPLWKTTYLTLTS